MSTSQPYLTGRALKPIISGLEALGHPVARILDAAGIDALQSRQLDGRVPQHAVSALWAQALAYTHDPALGLHIAEAAPIASFEVHAHAMLSSPSLRDAYRRTCRYQRLIHEVTDLTFDEQASEGVLRHALPGGRPASRHPAEFLVTAWVRLGRMVTGTAWTPTLVCFAHDAPESTSDHERVFHSRVRFASGRNEMHVSNAVLDATNPRADPDLGVVLDRYAEMEMKKLPGRPTSAARVRGWLHGSLSTGEPSAEGAARALNVSVRSLHRALQAEHTSFRDVLSRVRYEQARSLLADHNHGMSDVAFLLGFSELSSFYRAFKRWSGTTPAEYRAHH